MNRRMALLAAGAIALAGMGAVATRQLGGSSRGVGKVSLKSRILDYEKNFRTMRSRPSPKETDEHITAMMGEYFRIGMSYEDVIKTHFKLFLPMFFRLSCHCVSSCLIIWINEASYYKVAIGGAMTFVIEVY